MTKADSTPQTYYPWFDWLRGLLAIVVMLGHDGLIGWPDVGNFAVQVFFALSGWLIGGVLIQTPRQDLPRFYFNRAVRIWAPYYIALFLLVAASTLRDPVNAKWLEFVAYKLTFVYNLFGPSQLAAHRADMPLQGTGNHFWSVNAEEQFYLLAPLILVLAVPRFGRSVLTWLGIAAMAWFLRYYASIVFGVLAAVVASRQPDIFNRRAMRFALLAIGLAAAGGIAAGFEYELFAPPVAVAIVMLLAVKGPRQSLGALVGGMSYPLYLNHWIGVFVMNAALRPFGLRDSMASHVLSSTFNIAFATALYWYVDRRLLASRPRLYSLTRGRLAAGAAYGMVIAGLIFGVLCGAHK